MTESIMIVGHCDDCRQAVRYREERDAARAALRRAWRVLDASSVSRQAHAGLIEDITRALGDAQENNK